MFGKLAAPDAGNDVGELSSPDPDVPTQDYQAAEPSLVGKGRSEVESDRMADVPAPLVKSKPLIVLVRDQAEAGRGGQPLPSHFEPVIDLTHAGHRRDQILRQ